MVAPGWCRELHKWEQPLWKPQAEERTWCRTSQSCINPGFGLGDIRGPAQEGILHEGGLGQMSFVISYSKRMQIFPGSSKNEGNSLQPTLVKVLAGSFTLSYFFFLIFLFLSFFFFFWREPAQGQVERGAEGVGERLSSRRPSEHDQV